MRKHLIGWPGIGLLCAALASAQVSTTPEPAAREPAFTSSTSSSAIQNQQRLRHPEQRKALRAISRESTGRCRSRRCHPHRSSHARGLRTRSQVHSGQVTTGMIQPGHEGP
jgi:hypothetical protein